jgi:hypothetical protein
MRLQQSLAGSWNFQLDPEGILRVENLAPDRTIHVPLPWQAAFPELEDYSGYAWYVRDIDIDEQWLNGEVLLAFGAVDYWCEVYVNGQRVGEHEGGYTAFSFPIRSYLQPGKNQIAVHVYDAAYPGLIVPRWYNDPEQVNQPPFNPVHVPHGKQSWYIETGGIWQDVTLTAVPQVFIDHVRITPNIHTGTASIHITLGGDVRQAVGVLQAAVDSKVAEIQLITGQVEYEMAVEVGQPNLWTPETPILYTATITLNGGAGEDTQTIRFGFREIAVRDGQLLLNGEPIFLLSALDQDMYPETIYTVPSEAFMRDEFHKAKELGLNCLRSHIKPPDPLYLDLADEMGLLVWAEIPSWRTFYVKTRLTHSRYNVTDDIKARVNQTLREMIARDFNHPSLVIWSIVNEDWGTTVQLSPGDRAWLAEMYDVCKQLDPTRLVVDNSACLTNIHVKSDVDDYHIYTNIPDQAAFFEQFLENFSRRANWTYSHHGDAQRTGQEALILSEFGNWGLPSIEALRTPTGDLPDWFKLGPWWSGWEGEPGWPKDTLERFEQLGLGAIWKDYEAFAQASQWHQYQAMKYEIEVMRRQPALAGYVITELSDIYWESNGLMDFDRGKKVYHDVFAQVNALDVVVPRLPRYATWDDQSLPIQVFGSHYSSADWSDATLRLTLNGETQEQAVRVLPRGEVADFGVHELKFAATSQTATQRVDMTISGANHKTLAKNEVDVLVLPARARQRSYTGNVVVTAEADPLAPGKDTNLALANGLQKLGYDVGRTVGAGDLIVTGHPSDSVLKHVRDGGKMLYLSSGVGPFFWWQSRGGIYGGNWITSYTWLRPDVFPRLAVSNPLTLPYMAVMPTGVLIGLPVEDRSVQQDFLGGQFTGWISHPAIHTVQFRYGQGVVLMTTYALDAALNPDAPDPVAVAMLHDLIDYLASDRCQPRLTTNL